MIDIHTHVIFGVDDGPATIKESLALLRAAYSQGVRVVIATSHRHPRLFQTEEKDIKQRFEELVAAAQKVLPDLLLLYGAELYYTRRLVSQLERQELPTLNQTQFVLVEFPVYAARREIYSGLLELRLAGFTPILAHVERYDSLAFQKEAVADLIRSGVYIQVNSSHLLPPNWLGQYKSKTHKRAWYLLKEDLIHIVASDMHNLHKRPSFMLEAYCAVTKKYGQKRADSLFTGWAKSHLIRK